MVSISKENHNNRWWRLSHRFFSVNSDDHHWLLHPCAFVCFSCTLALSLMGETLRDDRYGCACSSWRDSVRERWNSAGVTH